LGAHPQGASLCKKPDRKCFPTHPQHPLLKRFQTEPEPQTATFSFLRPRERTKRPTLFGFEVQPDRRPPLTKPAICSLHDTPDSPSLHEPNVPSRHTNPEKSYVHRASLSPSAGATPARPHLDILPSRLFLGACCSVLSVLSVFCAFVLSCFRSIRAFVLSFFFASVLSVRAFVRAFVRASIFQV
jgi:hypothetical protein